jgi:hypothetical protein
MVVVGIWAHRHDMLLLGAMVLYYPNQTSFMAVTAHWIESMKKKQVMAYRKDFRLDQTLLDFTNCLDVIPANTLLIVFYTSLIA